MPKLAGRITVDPEQCGGRPCIRGMRIRVADVLDLLAKGLTPAQVLEELPDLEPEDIAACLRLRACNEALSHFEAKYDLTFLDFAEAWQEGQIPDKHSHEVERDFMEWEVRHLEKEDLLPAGREFGLREST
jgi:uncharacterized protein (DUF433 family)